MNKKQIVALVFIILAFLGLTFFFVFRDRENKSKYLFLFTGDTNIIKWYYNDDNWYIANTNEKLNDSFDVYSDGKYEGNYNLVFNNKWYYFDSNNKSKKIEGNNFMINTNYEFVSYGFRVDYIDDNNLVNKVSKEINIKNDDYLAKLRKFIVYNNDEFNDIYFVDYYKDQRDYNPLGPSYTVAFTLKNGTIDIIRGLSFSEIDNDSCSLNLAGVFTFENSNNKLLLKCVHFDQIPSDYYLYEYRWNDYNLLIEGNGGV